MKDDTGFAPNPFFGIMSLATCKPYIRQTKKVGDLVAGFTSKALCGDRVGNERLVFIMKITEKMTYDMYYRDLRFQSKKANSGSRITQCGDNIYFKGSGEYQQALAFFHRDQLNQEHDLISDNVLISGEFFYFGSKAILLASPEIKIPCTQSPYGILTKDPNAVNNLWEYLESRYQMNCLVGAPHSWKSGEPFNTFTLSKAKMRFNDCSPTELRCFKKQ